MTDLTEDEEAVLLIAAEGSWLAPIGRWEKPIKNLALRGLFFRKDDVNYGITDAGRQRVAQLNGPETDARLKSIIEMSNKAGAAQAYARTFVEPASQLLLQLAELSAGITGDPPDAAAEKWAQVILDRTKQLLAMKPKG